LENAYQPGSPAGDLIVLSAELPWLASSRFVSTPMNCSADESVSVGDAGDA